MIMIDVNETCPIMMEIRNIMSFDCEIISWDNPRGLCEYGDFLKYVDICGPVLKGMDHSTRPYMIFKIFVCYNLLDEPVRSFTTLYQRYENNKLIWEVCCFGDDSGLFNIGDNGVSLSQFKLLNKLLHQGTIYFDKDDENNEYDLITHFGEGPIKIQLGVLLHIE